MSGRNYNEQDADIDLLGLFGAIWKKRLRVGLVTAAVAGIAFVGANAVSPKYQAETRILIESRTPDFAQPAVSTDQTLLDEAGVASQVQILQSVDLIKAVSTKLKLHEVAEFDPTASPSILRDLAVLFGLTKNPLEMAPEERVIAEFTKRLQVYQAEKSRVIAIQFSSADPKLAAAIPNAMAEIYLSLQSGAKLVDNSDATKWLEPEIANLREKVREAETKVAEYRATSDLLKSGDQNTFVVQQLNDISQELARIRGERANAEARAENVRSMLKSGANLDTLGEVVGSQMIQRLKESRSTIEGQIADLSTTHLEGHPKLKALRAQLHEIAAQITRETGKILASLENEAATSRMRETQLIGQLNSLKAEAAQGEEQQVGLMALEREAASQRQLLETYLMRYREAASRKDIASTPADARIISTAVVPNLPYFPKILPITIVAGLAGFILSAVGVMLSELFSGRAIRQIPAAGNVPAMTGEPVAIEPTGPAIVDKPRPPEPVVEADVADNAAEIVPPVLAAGTQVANEIPTEPAREPETGHEPSDVFIDDEFSVNSVSRYLVEKGARIAICVSPTGDDGSAAAVMLARSVARAGLKAVLIDITGSGASSGLMGEHPHLAGITDLLAGQAPFTDTIHSDRFSDAHIVPQGNTDPTIAMRGIGRLPMIIGALADAYDLVVVECGSAEPDGVRQIVRDIPADVIISVGSAGRNDIDHLVGRFVDAGHEDIMLMMGTVETLESKGSRQAMFS